MITEKHDKKIFKDYSEKIKIKLQSSATDEDIKSVSDLVIFLNWSFNKKNNFFVHDFHKKKIFDIYLLYNSLKSIIFDPKEVENVKALFSDIEKTKIKTLNFIIKQYIANFDKIKVVEENEILCDFVSKDSMINLVQIIK